MDVRDVGVALWRQRPLVLLVLLLVGGSVALGVLLAPKTYEAQAVVSVSVDRDSADAADLDADEVDALRATLAELARGSEVVQSVRDELGGLRSTEELRRSLDATWRRGTVLVEVSARDRDPQTAVRIADAAADALEFQSVGGTDPFTVTTTEPATAPHSFASPDLRLVVALGLLIAVGLATAAAVGRDRRTHTVDDATDVEDAVTAPLLAHLLPPRDVTDLPTLQPGSADADLFRHLRIALEAQAVDGGSARAVLAGVVSGDLHVWVGANVAIALAETGRRVLLVDGRMGERFGTPLEEAPDTPGLYDVMLGADLDAAMSPGPVDGLRVLPAGTWGDESVERLIHERFGPVMQAAARDFDHVLVLGPPLESCDDARSMASDGALVLTVVEGSVSASALRVHADRARAAGARLLGVVLVARRPERAPVG